MTFKSSLAKSLAVTVCNTKNMVECLSPLSASTFKVANWLQPPSQNTLRISRPATKSAALAVSAGDRV